MNRDGIDHAFTTETDRGVWQEPTYSGALSFMRRRFTKDLTGVDVAATGIPLDTATTNRPGARFGPRAIREATPLLSWARPYGWDFDPLVDLSIVDYGDCPWDHGRLETMPDAITAHIRIILEAGAAPLSMGGRSFHHLSNPAGAARASRSNCAGSFRRPFRHLGRFGRGRPR